ncbi:MAG TPA: hypothetical protein VHT53_11705 [Candidatus Elarobacter sp.]|nr:hypothetical protein [Candidatus Elarobacter sp.]
MVEPPPAVEAPAASDGEPAVASAEQPDSDVVRDALRDARLFRAKLADAFDEALPRLLRELAVRVLARELRLAPCDLERIARDVLALAPAIRIRLAHGDSATIPGAPVVRDGALETGDAIVELDGGAVDARLGTRLQLVLEELA